MKTDITTVPEGTHFLYKEKSWILISRDEYPFIEAKCETEPNEYEGMNVIFGNFEKVEVPDGTKLWEPYFEQKGNTFYRKERLV